MCVLWCVFRWSNLSDKMLPKHKGRMHYDRNAPHTPDSELHITFVDDGMTTSERTRQMAKLELRAAKERASTSVKFKAHSHIPMVRLNPVCITAVLRHRKWPC